MAESDRPMDAATPREDGFSMATTAGVRYALSRSVAGTAAFFYALSMGRARGVLSGSKGYLDR